MTMRMFGLFAGPATVGLLSRHVDGEAHLNYAMASIPVLLIPVTRRPCMRRMERLAIR